ncbi:DUF6261 family protein [Abyssalbus ytuae]|uniref:DUF6261 family protein n=1 Tax=Abyssalbus ytuae TaxID=2926907 RepID=A0A9E6ZVR6_9FLAO|nr:DUF6261 family protein [Abyssalbus ytuae]UOB18673.1 DUF6261 family protein [Abyssalbus ytuae]
MEAISIPQLRLGQLQTLTEQTLELTKGIEQVTTYVAAVEEAFEPFLAGMLKDSAESDKKPLDTIRDQYLSGLFIGVRSETHYPHDTAQLVVLEKLQHMADKYGFKISKLPYDEETAAIDNLLAELETVDLQGMPQLARWIEKIKAANEDFKASSKEYLEGTVRSSATKSATAVAPALVAALDNLYTMLFAYTTVTADETIATAYQELSELVDTYRG